MTNIERWLITLMSFTLCMTLGEESPFQEEELGEKLKDPTTNYYNHPLRGMIIFVKVIFGEECKKFTFFTSTSNQPATPYVIYSKTMNGATLTFGYDYNREPFISWDSGHAKMKDSISVDIMPMPHGFSFIILYGSWKANLVFNGRMYFISGRDKMLMNVEYIKESEPAAYVSGCNPQKQRIIVRESPYLDPFNWATIHWLSNMRAFGPIMPDSTIICSLRYFPAGQGSFMLGVYGQRTRRYIFKQRSFMGLSLNHERTGFLDIFAEKKRLFITVLGEYDANNHYLLEETHDEFDLSIAMTLYDSTIKYRVAGSVVGARDQDCDNSATIAPNPCKPNPNDFYFGCLHVGYHLVETREMIVNRTASRCTLVGPSPYRSILDRSQQLRYTYGYWEDMALMRMQDEGNSTLVIDGVQMVPPPEPEYFDIAEDLEWY